MGVRLSCIPCHRLVLLYSSVSGEITGKFGFFTTNFGGFFRRNLFSTGVSSSRTAIIYAADMGNFMSPKKQEVKEAGEVIDGPVFDFIHIPSAGGAAGAIAAIGAILLLVWFGVKHCRRRDRASRIKNLRDLRRFAGGGGGEDVEMGFEMGPMSPSAVSRPLMFPAPFASPGAFPSPYGSPYGQPLALGWNPQPAPAIDYVPGRRARPRFHSPRIQEVKDEEELRKRPATDAPPPEPVDDKAGASRMRDAASGTTDRFRPDDYDWDERD